MTAGLGVAGVDGEARRQWRQWWSSARVGAAAGRGKGGSRWGSEEEQLAGGVRVLAVGERGGPAEAATATCGRGARDPPVRHSEGDAVFADTPLPAFFLFVFISLNETTIFSI